MKTTTKEKFQIALFIGAIIIALSAISFALFYPEKKAKDQNLPNTFIVKERMIGKLFGPTSFRIKDENGQYGKVVRDVLSPIKTTFSYENANGDLVVKGVKEFFSWGTKIDFYDNNEQPIGSIHEKVMESLFKWYTEYSILDKEGKEIAHSEKTEYFGKEIKISDQEGKIIAIMKKDYINLFRDTWNVTILQRDKIDVRIVPIIIAYKTYSDNKKSWGGSSKKGK